jgi:hypothetical protein
LADRLNCTRIRRKVNAEEKDAVFQNSPLAESPLPGGERGLGGPVKVLNNEKGARRNGHKTPGTARLVGSWESLLDPAM